MDSLLFFLGIIGIIVLIAGVLFFLLIRLYRWIRRTRFRKYAFVFPTIIVLFFCYEVYFAIWPKDSFYIEDFERLSHKSFPSSGVILYKDADYPDQHGKYSSAVLMSLSTEDYDKFWKEIVFDKTFAVCNIQYNLQAYKSAHFDEKYITKQYYKGPLLISFFEDHKTIFIQKCISDFSFMSKAKIVSK